MAPSASVTPADPALRERVLTLEARIAELERQQDGPVAEAVATTPAVRVPLIDADAAWATGVAELETEWVDGRWARAAAADLARDLDTVAAAGRPFRVTRSRCASVHCLATLEFAGPVTDDDISRVLHHAYASNCARTVHVEPPQGGAMPATLGLLFDCGS